MSRYQIYFNILLGIIGIACIVFLILPFFNSSIPEHHNNISEMNVQLPPGLEDCKIYRVKVDGYWVVMARCTNGFISIMR